jgi:hypothetical protein
MLSLFEPGMRKAAHSAALDDCCIWVLDHSDAVERDAAV